MPVKTLIRSPISQRRQTPGPLAKRALPLERTHNSPFNVHCCSPRFERPLLIALSARGEVRTAADALGTRVKAEVGLPELSNVTHVATQV